MTWWLSLFLCVSLCVEGFASVRPGVDQLFTPRYAASLKGHRIGLITNHTAIDSQGRTTLDRFKAHQKEYGYTLQALFAPEHGLDGTHYAGEGIVHGQTAEGIPIHSLHGETRRPTPEMLRELSLLIYDIQDLGSRSYTYSTTLCYAMEAAAAAQLPVIVLDRPNPLSGVLIDGPVLEKDYRSFVGYLDIPYCHGMTIGELARYFNGEYGVGCSLTVVPLEGWKREMTFEETGLLWVPTSPQIPCARTAFYYPSTGILGEISLVNIGVGYTLPFQVIGAPWIDAARLAHVLNTQQLPGVSFTSFHYRPFFGKFVGQECHGVLLHLTDPHVYLPVTTQYAIMGLLKTLYPQQFAEALKGMGNRLSFFNKINGTGEVARLLGEASYATWPLRALHQKEKARYRARRERYLLPKYADRVGEEEME